MNQSGRSEPDTFAERRFPVLLRTAWFALNKAFRNRLSDTGLTPARFTVLRWLVEREADSLSQSDLAELTASNPNNVTSLVTHLEVTGHIVREKAPGDSRLKILRITPKGRSTYDAVKEEARNLQEEVMAGFAEDSRDDFLRLLEQVNENLRTTEEPQG